MSNISSTHTITSFDSKTSKAYEGQRLAKIIYKILKDKDGKELPKKFESVCVSIPPVASAVIIDNIAAFVPYLRDWYADKQDAIIRARYELGATSISDEQINASAVLEYLEEEAKGGRLTKDDVIIWFKDSLADTLAVAFADKLGMSNTPSAQEEIRIEQMVAVYRDKFAALAGGKTQYAKDIAIKLQKALELADSNPLTDRFTARLDKMINTEDTLADLL